MLGLPDGIHACLFDLDGVLTDTASVHRRAWKAMFDEYLRSRDGDAFVAFDAGADYENYVDGKPRDDGVRSLPGQPQHHFSTTTMVQRARRPQERAVPADDAHRRRRGVRRITALPEGRGRGGPAARGRVVERQHPRGARADRAGHLRRAPGRRRTLRDRAHAGKPAPDSFLRAAQLLDVDTGARRQCSRMPSSGVAAGRAGHFGVVVGVDRVGQADALRDNGADIVVTDLGELLSP